EPVYAKLFRAEGQKSPEKLIALYWSPSYDPYPSININHCDLGPAGLNETGAWGQWNYVTLDLVGLFDQKTIDPAVTYGTAGLRPDSFLDENLNVAEGYDQRRPATMCMYHDYIPFWQRDKENGAPDKKKGFYCTYNLHQYDDKNSVDMENETVAEWVFPSGAAPVKQIHGSIYDHEQEYGCTPSGQGSCTPMILLRTADVYLCAAEAYYHKGDIAKAKEYIKIVRDRAGVGDKEIDIDMENIIDERRRELAFEGDNYYDFRRWSYFDLEGAKAYILGQERNPLACGYFDGKNGDFPATFKNPGANANDPSDKIKLTVIPTNAKGEPFLLMYPAQDLISNPKLNEPAVPYNFEAAGYDKSKI
ncbi:MAG: RagB/SusD family nutrient uptake outer membrane protein, partial [Bacteroidales bacterium]|nr:RagB/SusD family nutrient uptake outer membrane protein [Bacteroidales bacterium]